MPATSPAAFSMTPPIPANSGNPPDTGQVPDRTSVVIADRNPVFLRGLASVLEAERDFVVVASCQDEAECIAAIRALSPSLALVDMSLSEPSGLQVLEMVRTEALATRVVLLSSSANTTEAARAFSMGARGVVPRDSAPQSLIWSLRQVMSGQQLALLAVSEGLGVPDKPEDKPEERVVALTVRERQIVELVSTGLSNREVGVRLNISEGTIKVHLHHIFKKLSIRNRTVLANIGRESPEPLRRR